MERLRRRADLREERGPSGELAALHDPLLARRIDVGPLARALLAALDGERSTEEAIAAVAAAESAPSEAVAASLRALLLVLVFEGAGEETLARVRRAAAAPPELVFLEGARFECQGSGACCRGYQFGPVTARDRERLLGFDLVGAGLGEGPYLVERAGEHFLRTHEDGRCVFLRGDARCGLHAAFGAAAKPAFCQLYPLRALPTIEGWKVHDGGECATSAVSGRSGPLLEAERERLRALLPEKCALEHPVIHLGALPCDMGYVLAMQRAAVAALAAPLPAAAALRALSRVLHGAVSALETAPLVPGAPERALAAASPLEAPATDALVRVLDHLQAAFSLRGPFGEMLSLALHLAVSRIDSEIVLTHDHAAVARVAASGPDFDEPLRYTMRTAAFGDALLLEKRLLAGVARLATASFLIATGARLRAHREGSPAVRAPDVSFAQHTVLRALRRTSVDAIFVEHEASAWSLAEAAAQGM